MTVRTSTIFEAVPALVALLEGLSYSPNVHSGDTPAVWDGIDSSKGAEVVEVVHTIRTADSEFATFGNVKSEERYEVVVRVHSNVNGSTKADVYARLGSLVETIFDGLRDDTTGVPTTLGVTGVQWAQPKVAGVDVYPLDDVGHGGVAELIVAVYARI